MDLFLTITPTGRHCYYPFANYGLRCWEVTLYKITHLEKWQSWDLNLTIMLQRFSTHLPSHGLSWWLNSKESTCNTGDVGSIPRLGISPGGGNGSLLQYSCLGSSVDRRAWWTTVHRVAKGRTQLSNWACTHQAPPCHLSWKRPGGSEKRTTEGIVKLYWA